MTLEVLAFGFGCLLIITAIVGGGLEIKEIKIPRVGPGVRVVCLALGGVFLMLGLGLAEMANPGAFAPAMAQTNFAPVTDAAASGTPEPAASDASNPVAQEPAFLPPAFEGLQAEGQIAWNWEGTPVSGTLVLEGQSGWVRVSAAWEGTEMHVDQDLVLQEEGGSYFYQGVNPRNSSDQTPAADYSPDRFRLAEVQQNQWTITESCDARVCAPAAVEWQQE